MRGEGQEFRFYSFFNSFGFDFKCNKKLQEDFKQRIERELDLCVRLQ